MSSFTKPLTVTKLKSGKWKVERGFTYYVGKEDSDESIAVPSAFETDFASVPRIFWNIIPPDGQYSQGAVLHDYLYSCVGCVGDKEYLRKECDKIFLESMTVLGVGFRRRIMYRAVRMFGGFCWNKETR